MTFQEAIVQLMLTYDLDEHTATRALAYAIRHGQLSLVFDDNTKDFILTSCKLLQEIDT